MAYQHVSNRPKIMIVRHMKSKPNAEFDAFTRLVDRVLSVPHTEILRREKEYQKQVAQNPKRRGPKRKVKPSGDHELADKD
jgi:hypothetical protein